MNRPQPDNRLMQEPMAAPCRAVRRPEPDERFTGGDPSGLCPFSPAAIDGSDRDGPRI